jgi:hypothetical protein
MASKKAAKGDLNAPLRSLSERLRSLQREAGQLLEAARIDSRRGDSRAGAEPGPGREAQMGRVAANLFERWDIPTRSDLDEIHQRLDRLEEALRSLRPAGKAAPTSKTRQRRGAREK